MQLRNIIILISCQLISATGAFIMVALGGIIGAKLSVDPAFSTLPVSVMVLCMAATTVPATMLMQRLGRRRGFSLASVSAVLGMLLAGMALYAESFKLFVLAGATLGINMAFTQQYRYAASESVGGEYSSRAISYVLLGAIGGALAGPEFVKHGEFAVPSVQYLGTLLAMAGMYTLQSVLFLILGPMHGEDIEAPRREARPLREIVRQPIFIVALVSGATAYGVMTFIMTATPLSMHIHDGFGLEETARVIQSHVLAMYVPSLVAGHLIHRYGLIRIMSIGALGLVAACMVGLQGQSYMHYWYTLVLLGVGWNFLYVGATTMVTLTYRLAERFRAQAVNEFFVFGASAMASLLAGAILHLLGWFALIVVPVPLLLITLTGLLLVRKDPLVARLKPSPE